jgi:hypothetical protein
MTTPRHPHRPSAARPGAPWRLLAALPLTLTGCFNDPVIEEDQLDEYATKDFIPPGHDDEPNDQGIMPMGPGPLGPPTVDAVPGSYGEEPPAPGDPAGATPETSSEEPTAPADDADDDESAPAGNQPGDATADDDDGAPAGAETTPDG